MAIDERAALIAERSSMLATLRDLSPEDWDHASLCRGWRVRDVVSHVARPLGIGDLLRGFVRHRGSFDAISKAHAIDHGERPVEQILADFARFAATSKTPPGIKVVDQAIDVFVHHQDVGIPLGRVVPVDPARLRWMADGMVAASRFIGSARRVKDLRFIATDIDWHYGTGPEIQGPAAALILGGCGRHAAHAQLHGDGVDVLASRP